MQKYNVDFPSEKILQREYRGWPPIERVYLEEALIPDLAKDGNILFIGTSWYTRDYKDLVPENTKFITVDVQETKSPDIVADITQKEFVEKVASLQVTFSTIIFNGVIGYGINDEGQLDRAIENMKTVLEPKGKILIGWNLYAATKKHMLSKVAEHQLSIVPIENKKVYYGTREWSKIVRLRFMLLRLQETEVL